MAKTIMVSNDVYEKLKNIKEKREKSYSEVITELVNMKKVKTVGDLRAFFGVFKGDKEYGKIIKETRKGWAKWTKKYA